ncbi:hypothetical protein JG688_00015106 [Phytophthora aleatoria]|uniref:Uncharacterized protein n=1 Tax=Phytophthora aleatoria TaxID=2496075 RepID=A0A8J5IAR8_9STRA|nr:hypothetical protein JG688_00015106 [Phytophthora aleatoria]
MSGDILPLGNSNDIHHTSNNGTVFVDPAVIERSAQVCSSTSYKRDFTAKPPCRPDLPSCSPSSAATQLRTSTPLSTRRVLDLRYRQQLASSRRWPSSSATTSFLLELITLCARIPLPGRPRLRSPSHMQMEEGDPVIATESWSATSGAAGTWPTEDRCARRTRLGQPANTQGADSN